MTTLIKRVVSVLLMVWILCLPSTVRAEPTPPGTIITLIAGIDWGGKLVDTTWKRLIVLNPLFKDRVFYVCGDWKNMMPGIRIRWNQCVGRSFITCEGVTTTTGHILTDHGGLIDLKRTVSRF